MGSIGPLEIGIVLVIALLVFGPKKLPELGRSVGGGLREFKSTVTNFHDKDDKPAEVETDTEAQAPPKS